jgi:hypothetical protein
MDNIQANKTAQFYNTIKVTFSMLDVTTGPRQPRVDFFYLEVVECHCAKLSDKKIYLYGPQSSIKSWAQKS